MLPISATEARSIGLVDQVYEWDPSEPHGVPELFIKDLVQQLFSRFCEETVNSAPWVESTTLPMDSMGEDGRPPLLIDYMCQNKRDFFARERTPFNNPPLVHYRNEELSQMLLDCFHPTRSLRYHTRRRAFIRKFKTEKTPTRYMSHFHDCPDPEDTECFDDTGPWRRGDEWRYIEELPPASLETSAWTRVPLFPDPLRQFDYQLTQAERVAQRQDIVRTIQEYEASLVDADVAPEPGMTSSISNSTIGDILQSPQSSPVDLPASTTETEGAKQIAETEQSLKTSESGPVTKVVESVETIHPCFFNDPAAH